MHIILGISFNSFQRKVQKTFTAFIIVNAILTQQLLAQVNDNFSDNEFSTNPVWAGKDAKFVVTSNQLKLQALAIADNAWLSTPSISINNASWEFYVRMDFNPSSANYSRIYLVSDKADLSGPLNGYFVMIGNTDDEISLYKQTGTTKTEIIDGLNGRINTTLVKTKVKVTRDALGNWELFSDVTLSSSYTSEGLINEGSHLSSSYFGVYCAYTSSNSAKFYFDDFVVLGNPFVDVIAPALESTSAITATELELTFSEILDQFSAENILNFELPNGIHPAGATLLTDGKSVKLNFTSPFVNGVESLITVSSVKDIAGNAMPSVSMAFLYFQPSPLNFKDVVITEIFPDYSPTMGLPEAEFVEIYNRSANPVDLNNWKLTDGNSIGTLGSKILLPDNYLILSSSANEALFTSKGKTLSVASFPTLNNSGDQLILKDINNVVVDSVLYAEYWYRDDDKAEGGWTLEIIDPNNFCKGDDNWIASKDTSGGTPGKQNSVNEKIDDIDGPQLLSVTQDSTAIILLFNEKLSTVVPSALDFQITPMLEIKSVSFADPSFRKIKIDLFTEPEKTKTYFIESENIYDCPGNKIQDLFAEGYLNLDTIPPAIKEIKLISQREVEIIYTEALDTVSTKSLINYSISERQPSSVTLYNETTVRILFSELFENGFEYPLLVKNIKDINGNSIDPVTITLLYFEPKPAFFKDIIVTEIFADPDPSIGLPEVEFVEIFNRSVNPIDLKNWTISDGNSVSKFYSTLILPGKYLILCSTSSYAHIKSFGKTVGLSNFPSLNNAGDALILNDQSGVLIDSIHYSDYWIKDENKREGGYTLELIDPQNICSEENNWTVSESEIGGTPGVQNSVFANKPDLTGPQLLSVIPTAENLLIIKFDEKLHKTLPATDAFTIDRTQVVNLRFSNNSLKELELAVNPSLEKGLPYNISITNVYDCSGNEIQSDYKTSSFGLPEQADSLDVVINEVLFNPRPTGVDFVEVYNRSQKFINIKNWTLANFEDNLIVNLKIISEDVDFVIAPDAYVVLTSDANVLKGEYILSRDENFLETISLPSMNDDDGSVALLNQHGNVVDFFQYTKKMHSVFIKEDEGVSLERVSFGGTTMNGENWKSASSTVGFATPGYLNSNARAEALLNDGAVTVDPEIFEPLSGLSDFTRINYQFDQGGFVANVKVYDPQGREIKKLAENEILGSEGFFRWDGDDNNGLKARMGFYMIWFQVFDDKGTVQTFKKRVAIAGKF